jgi:hypothetical protein
MIRTAPISFALATATLLGGCTFSSIREATDDKVFAAIASINALRGPVEACVTLVGLLVAFMVVDDALGGPDKRNDRDPSDEL